MSREARAEAMRGMIPAITAATIADDSDVRGRALIAGALLPVSSLEVDADNDEERAA